MPPPHPGGSGRDDVTAGVPCDAGEECRGGKVGWGEENTAQLRKQCGKENATQLRKGMCKMIFTSAVLILSRISCWLAVTILRSASSEYFPS